MTFARDRILDDLPAVPVPAEINGAMPNPSDAADWPQLGPAAFHGPAGRFATEASPFTEADPTAVLVTALAGLGCAINAGPHVLAGNDRHGAAIFPVLVGATAKGGKGTSWAVARSLIEVVDPNFVARRILGGFGSGEAVVDALRDPDDDNGKHDTRLLLFEPEFGRMLRVAGRDGSTLSMVVRDGWDGRPLQARSRAATSVASVHHIAVVAHVTTEELRARLTDVETYGGFANRFLFCCVRRTRLLPAGGNVPAEIVSEYGQHLRDVVSQARRAGRITRTPAAEERWSQLYHDLAGDEPGGLLAAVTGRDAPQCLRLSLLYALLDGAPAIGVDHIEAAAALWWYSRASAEFIFGDAIGDQDADKLLAAIRRAGAEGLSGDEQHTVLGRHVNAKRLDAIRGRLQSAGKIHTVAEATGGRPRLVSYPGGAEP